MNITGLIQRLKELNVEVWLAHGKLRYRAPKQLLTATLLAELKANKPALIAYLQEQEQRPFPLTYGQQALWFLHQAAPNSAAYNVAFSAKILTAVDSECWYQSLCYLSQRHPALRLRFQAQMGKPEQFISPEKSVDYQLIDATAWTDATLDKHVNASYQTAFKLNAQQALFRVRLFQCSAQQYLLLIVFHHIIGDAWSLWLLIEELTQIYASLRVGQTPDLPVSSVTYRQFAEQQVLAVESGALEQDWLYWRDKFSHNPPVLNLPCQRPFPIVRSYQGASYPLRIDKNTVAVLKSVAANLEVTLYSVLLAAYQLLLHRCSAQQQLCIGTPFAGRDDEQYANVVGYFVNPMPLLSSLDAQLTVAEFIKASSQEVLGAMAHQRFPLALLLSRLSLARDNSRPPLFQASFAFQQLQKAQHLVQSDSGHEAQAKTSNSEELIFAPYTLHQQLGQFDLTLELVEAGGELIGSIKFNTDVMDTDDGRRLTDYYQQLLRSIRQYKDQKAISLPLLTETYRQQILIAWNATAYNYADGSIAELLSNQADLCPDAIALVYQQTQLSYSELEQRSNQLAHYLQQQGIGPESIVAVCMHRSLELLISVHAIIKAGAAFLCLDPDLPQQRLDYMIADADATVCLCQQVLADKFCAYQGRLLAIETLQLQQLATGRPHTTLHADNIAYLIYTSGSTGHPKAVAISHKALLNQLNWMRHYFRSSEQDRYLQITPYSFDVSVFELFWPLLSGACLILLKPGGHKDSQYLCQLIQSQQVNTLHFVPSMLQAFINEPDVRLCTSIKRIFCGGEALAQSLQQQVLATLDAELYNFYGPTETTIVASTLTCRQQDYQDSSIVPIGKPIANMQWYILDKQLQPVPIGVIGELYIAGVGLARGYPNNAALTAERFIPNPFGQGDRLYRTGDICRYRADGVIDYLSREDSQIKLRGFRIELGEIENVLKQHPDIQDAAVKVWEQDLSKRLVAYWVGKGQHNLTDELKQQVLQLPSYMRPSQYVNLPQLPLTANGKLDRTALRQPEINVPQQYTAARNNIEHELIEIWQALLKLEKIGIHDNFFELGGDSISSIQIVANAKQRGITLGIEDMFIAQTVAELAEIIQQRQ